MFQTCLLRRVNGDPTIFFCDWHITHRRIQKPFSWANVGAKKFWSPLIDNPVNDGFWTKISIFFTAKWDERRSSNLMVIFWARCCIILFFFKVNPCRTWITNPHLGTAVTDNNSFRVRAVFHKTLRVCHVYCNFKIGFTCRITIIFGTLKDGSLLINTLASNICFSYRNMFQNGVEALSKIADAFLSKSSKFYLVRIIR